MRFLLRIYFGLVLVYWIIWLTGSVVQGQVLGEKTEITLKGDGTSGPFFISQNYILLYTEEVTKDSAILERDKDYLIDYNKGLLWLEKPLGKNDSVTISFEEFSSGIKKRYFNRALSFEQEGSASNPSIRTEGNTKAENTPYNFKKSISQISRGKNFSPHLQISGSKSFSLDLGGYEALSLSQGLNLSISGDLTKEVKVLALISDKGGGGNSYATTKRLEELDKVLMRVTSPHFSGFLGDQYLKLEGNLTGRYEKKLQGVSSELKLNQNSISMSYASSRGRYSYDSFSGVEGKQGPYYLKAENGKRGIQVLPGTEKVYLDGKLLERGSDNDYTMDYPRGVLYFSSTRLITGDSRIKVEFEYSDQSYEKSFYNTGGEFNLFQGKLKLKGIFTDEREDGDNPLSFAFSSEDKAILKNSGDDGSKAFKDGIQYAGEGEGDYILLTDSLGNPYYQYAGKDSGAYLVSFSWVGESKGSYIYKGGGIYGYVYPGNGDYLPIVYLPLPSSHSLLDLSLGLNLFEGFSSEIGWGLSRKDHNTFSDFGDEDNSGNALYIKTGFEKQDLPFLGYNLPGLKLEGSYRNLGKSFTPFGRIDEIEKERVWGLVYDSTAAPGSAPENSEKVLRFKSSLSPLENLNLGADFGILKRGDFYESRRERLEIAFRLFRNLEAKASTEDIKSMQEGEFYDLSGYWQRRNFYLDHRFKILNSQLGWEMEKQEFSPQDSSRVSKRYDELKGKIGLEPNKLLILSTQLIYRQEEREGSSGEKEEDSYTWQNRFSLRNYKDVFSSNFEYIHRQKELESGEITKGDLGVFKLDYYPRNQSLVINLYYSVNLLGSEKRVDNYIEVGEKKGEYRFENGEYIPDPEGNYILQKEILDEVIPGKRLDKSFRTVFKPGKLFPAVKLFKKFYTDTFTRVSSLVSGGVNWGSFLLNPFSFSFTPEVLLKDYSTRYDLYFLPSALMDIRLRWTQDERDNLLLLSARDKDLRTSQSALLRYRISYKNLFESELTQEKRERQKVYANSLLIQGRGAKVGYTRRENNSLEINLSGKLKKEEEKKSGLETTLFEFSPKLTYSFPGKGRIRSEFNWFRVSISPDEVILPWEMAEGKRPGDNFTWGLGFDFKLNQTVSVTLNYTGLKEPVRGTRHNGRVEIKTYF